VNDPTHLPPLTYIVALKCTTRLSGGATKTKAR
jgi:hypothetical protein